MSVNPELNKLKQNQLEALSKLHKYIEKNRWMLPADLIQLYNDLVIANAKLSEFIIGRVQQINSEEEAARLKLEQKIQSIENKFN